MKYNENQKHGQKSKYKLTVNDLLSLGFFFSGGERNDSYAEGGKYKEEKKGKDSSLQSQRSMHILGDK